MALGEGDLKGKSNFNLQRSAQEVLCVILNTNMPLSLKKSFLFSFIFVSFLVINDQVRKLWGQYKMKAISKYAAKNSFRFVPSSSFTIRLLFCDRIQM